MPVAFKRSTKKSGKTNLATQPLVDSTTFAAMLKLPRFRIVTMLLLATLFTLGLGWWQDWHRRHTPLYLHIFLPQNRSENNPAPPTCVATMGIPAHGQIEIRHAEHEIYSGQVTCSPSGRYHLELKVSHPRSFGFNGPVSLDAITMPQTFLVSGHVRIQVVALSHDKDGQSLLNAPDLSETENQLLFLEI